MKILVTHFDPFGGEEINSAAMAAQLLPAHIGDVKIFVRQLPTVYATSAEICKRFLSDYSPDLLLMLGQATGRCQPELEKVGINWDNSAHPDNAGDIRQNLKIDPGAPDALFSTLPIEQMAESCRKLGLPAGISLSAGSFVCNHLMFCMLNHIKANSLPIKAAFLHLPATPGQTTVKKIASMPSPLCADIITQMLKTAIDICKSR